MTRENDEIEEVHATVLVFDICSSTDILEDLHLNSQRSSVTVCIR